VWAFVGAVSGTFKEPPTPPTGNLIEKNEDKNILCPQDLILDVAAVHWNDGHVLFRPCELPQQAIQDLCSSFKQKQKSASSSYFLRKIGTVYEFCPKRLIQHIKNTHLILVFQFRI
jgi:hypothetical protein